MSSNQQHDTEKAPTRPIDQSTQQAETLGEEPASASPAKPPMGPWHEILFVVITCSSNIFTQASLGMTIAPLKIIGSGLSVSDPGGLSWFVAAYALTVGTFILIAGRLGDMFGHKSLFVAGFFWYGLWSVVAGLSNYAHSGIFFDVCRALQGVGPAMMVPNSLAILGRTYPPGRRKEMVFSIYGATAPNGFIVGAVFGSLLAKRVSWPWEFYVMGIACFVFGSMSIFVIPSAPKEDGVERNLSFDYLGAVTGVAGLVLFNVAWNQAPSVGWDDPSVIVLLILGTFCIVGFLFIEKNTARALIPQGAISGKVGFVLGCIALGWSSFGIWVYYFFQFIENLRNVTPLEGAAQTIPAGISGCAAALTTGYILSRLRTSYVMAISMLGFCIGNILIATAPIDQTYWANFFVATVITPWGMDMSFPAATIILSDLVPREHQGIAASLVVTIVNYSISIGLGIAGTVESHVNDGGQDLLKGYRGAAYAGIGLSGSAILLSLLFVVSEGMATSKALQTEEEHAPPLKKILTPVKSAAPRNVS